MRCLTRSFLLGACLLCGVLLLSSCTLAFLFDGEEDVTTPAGTAPATTTAAPTRITVGGVSYIRERGGYTVSGCSASCTSVTVPASFHGLPVLRIGDCAFEEATDLRTVSLPASVTEIGEDAFFGLTRLTSVKFAAGSALRSVGEGAFMDCIALEEIDLPDTVILIGDLAFSGAGLTGVTLPRSLTEIGEYAFSTCASLTEVTFPDGGALRTLGEGAFADCGRLASLTLPASLREFGAGALAGCYALREISLASGSTALSVRDGHLYSYDGSVLLQYAPGNHDLAFTLPDGVREVGPMAALGALFKTLTLPEGVERIGDNAFTSCLLLGEVHLPASLTSLGKDAFLWCASVTEYSVAAGNTVCRAQGGVLYTADMSRLLYYPAAAPATSFSVPEGVRVILGGAFFCASHLQSVTLPASLTDIEADAFRACTSLTDFQVAGGDIFFTLGKNLYATMNGITILVRYAPGSTATAFSVPNGVAGIMGGAFSDAAALATVAFPESVRLIEGGCFEGCTSLTYVFLPANTDWYITLEGERLDITSAERLDATLIARYMTVDYSPAKWQRK